MISPQEHIEAMMKGYLNGSLSPKDATSFEQMLADSSELTEQFENEKLMHELLSVHSAVETSAAVKAEGERFKRKVRLRKVLTSMAIGALVGVGLIYFRSKVEANSSGEPERTTAEIVEDAWEDTTLAQTVYDLQEKTSVIDDSNLSETERVVIETVSEVLDSVEKERLVREEHVQEVDVVSKPEILETQDLEVTKPCEKPVPELFLAASCDNKASGVIEFSNIIGGVAPYEVKLNEKTITPDVVEGLGVGVYTLTIKDQLGCIFTKEVEIEGEYCEEKVYAFNPDVQDYWEIPNEKAQTGRLQLYNKNGQLIADQQLTGEEDHWFGVTKTGDRVSKGVFLFIVTYEDGTSLKDELNINW